jgi:hypothetical protein
MKAFILFLSFFSGAAFAAEAGTTSGSLHCPGFNGVVIEAVSLTAKSVSVMGYFPRGEAYEIPGQTEGDCAGKATRGFLCFQDGQFMINIPKGLASGRVQSAGVWINDDTDDNPSNGRKGALYTCTWK